MKFATLDNGGRDGQLVVVSRDLAQCVAVPQLATCLQDALDRWDELAPKLLEVYTALNQGKAEGMTPFDASRCLSPLPRAYQFVDGSAYLNHVELVRKARGAVVPESFYTDPLVYQGGSDSFLAPQGVIHAQPEWGIDFEGEVAVVTGDVPMGATPEQCRSAIRLVMLMNDVSLRDLLKKEITKELGFVQSKPASAFAPVAVTPDELGDAWRDCKVHLPLVVHLNNALFGKPNAGNDMNFDFSQIISHVALTRNLAAGSIVGGGTVSNKQDSLWGSSINQGGVGYCCLAELRMYETIELGQPKTPFMTDGDVVRLEMLAEDGSSLFGTIENRVSTAA